MVPLPEMPAMFTLTDEPLDAETLAMVPVAPAPTRVKSSVETFATGSSKVTVKAIDESADDGEPDTTMLLTEGGLLSTLALVVSDVAVALP